MEAASREESAAAAEVRPAETPISVEKPKPVTAARRVRRRGRPSRVEKVQRTMCFAAVNKLLVAPGEFYGWVRTGAAAMASWSEARCLTRVEYFMLLAGEIAAMGHGAEVAATPQPLAFELDDIVAIGHDAARSAGVESERACAIVFDILLRNLLPLAVARCAEAAGDDAHPYHDRMWFAYGDAVTSGVMLPGLRPVKEEEAKRPDWIEALMSSGAIAAAAGRARECDLKLAALAAPVMRRQ